MQSNLSAQLPKIHDMFKPNPMVSLTEWEASFHLKEIDTPEQVEIEIHQYIFRRATIRIQKQAGVGFSIKIPGQENVTGPDDLDALKDALSQLGFVQTAKQSFTQLFTSAKRTKNKYPRKGHVRRA